MLGSGHDSEGSGVLIKSPIKRGWDWRCGFPKNSNWEDVVRVLRLGIAKEIGRAWVEDETYGAGIDFGRNVFS